MYCTIKRKILIISYTVLLVFNIQYVNALVSNAKAKQLIDQEAAEKLEQQKLEQQRLEQQKQELEKQKQENEKTLIDSQTSTQNTTDSTIHEHKIDSTIKTEEQNTNNINIKNTNTIDQITFCATQDYEKTKMRAEISNLQKNTILLQEKNKNRTALASANFDLEKSKLRENNRIEEIKKEEMINNNIKSFVAVDNNLSQERTERIWYRKILTTPESYEQ